MSHASHMNSLEVKIMKDIDNQLVIFKNNGPNSLIKEWFNNYQIKSPKLSDTAFKGDITFIAQTPKANYSGPGIMIFSKQNSRSNCYIGNFNKGKRDGKGWRLMRGYIYIGNYRNDAKHGKAIMIKENDGELIFEGNFHDDKMHGECFWKDNNHSYRGNINMQVYDGKCSIEYPNGDHFSGVMKNGSIEGIGKLRYSNGDVYEGEFKKNMMSGKGTYTWKNGESFNGEFIDGKIKGKGVMTSPIGVRAEGDFSNKQLPFELV